jgi:hypothetical protein
MVETYQLCFRVFICAFNPEISSFIQQDLPIYILMFVYSNQIIN